MRKKATVLTILAFVVFVAYMLYSSMGLAQVNCEVCVEFRGQTECRRADGTNAAEAQKTATSVACALLTSGMTDSIACENSPPQRVTCKGQ